MDIIKIEEYLDYEMNESGQQSPQKEPESLKSESQSPSNVSKKAKRQSAASEEERSGLITISGSKPSGGRPTLYFIRKYFIYDKETNTSKCNIDSCTAILKGQHSPTLERHIMRFHPVEKIAIGLERKRRERENENMVTVSSEFCANCSMSMELDTSLKRKNDHITIAMNEETLKRACTQLVTTDGRPLSILHDSGLRLLIDPILVTLNADKAAAQKITVNKSNIRAEVQEKAKMIRAQIQKEVNGRLVCLKVDKVTRLDRQVLGINIQFIDDNKIKLRTLCVKELLASHTAEDLKLEIMEVLRDFGISPAMIYTVTLDNASNMLKTGHPLSESSFCDDNGSSSSDDEDEEESVIKNLATDALVREACIGISASAAIGVPCVAHNLQLAISDVLKRNKVKEALNQARSLSVLLRTPSVTERLNATDLKKPSLDCVSRWHSSYDMIASLLPLKEFCQTDFHCSQTQITESMWNQFEELVWALQPAKFASKRLQCEQLTAGDCFEIWLRCKIQTGKMSLEIASDLCSAMSNREVAMLNCKAFLGVIYLDPRFHTILNLQQREQAQTHLESVWFRLVCLNETFTSKDEEDDLEAFLRSREFTNGVTEEEASIRFLLQHFHRNTPRSKPSIWNLFNVLEYWRSREKSHPQLHALATTVLALPTTQVSVENLVSHLKQTLSILRYKLRPEVIDNMLIVTCNSLFE